jgi:hypothetical protein
MVSNAHVSHPQDKLLQAEPLLELPVQSMFGQRWRGGSMVSDSWDFHKLRTDQRAADVGWSEFILVFHSLLLLSLINR